MAEHYRNQKTSGLPPVYSNYNKVSQRELWQRDNYHYKRPSILARYKLLWQSLAAIVVFGLVIAVCRADSPQMVAFEEDLKGWFVSDSNVTPVVAWLENMGFRENSFDKAGYEVIKANASVSRIAEEMTVPVTGKVIAAFGWQKNGESNTFNQGITIETAADEPIKAAYAGTVQAVNQQENGEYTITIAHANGLITTYGACSNVYVKADQIVDKGEIIAICGKAQGEVGKLYFETKHLGEPVDPLSLVKTKEV